MRRKLWEIRAWFARLGRPSDGQCPRQEEIPGPMLIREHVQFWRKDGTCSFCGSVSPEMFFEAIKDGIEIGPTDKGYKVYIRGLEDKVHGAGKFYFQHLSEGQRKGFIRMLNEDRIKLGYPGHFYVLPYFIQKKRETS